MAIKIWSVGAVHNLDFRILILDLKAAWPIKQFAFNIFNLQSKFQNLKST
jgi:hypothetical protein